MQVFMLKKLPLRGFIYAALALDLIAVLAVVITRGNLPPVVPLFYGRPVGGTQLITAYGLAIAPAFAIIVTIVNVLLAPRMENEFLKKILSVASFLISALSLITVIKIIFLVSFW